MAVAPAQMNRRGFTLIAVLVIVGSALLIATSLLYMGQAEVAGAARVQQVAQSRSLAASALDVIVQELHSQRDTILTGEPLSLDEQYELYERGSMLGAARLMEITPDGKRVQSEAGKLDLNAEGLTADMLAATGMVEPDQAQAILDHRDARPGGMFHSTADLLEVDGIGVETLYGPVEDVLDALTEVDEENLESRMDDRFASDEPRGLADVVTVFAVEPNLQQDGRKRINLNVEWSEELGARLDDRLGEGAGAIVKEIIDSGTTFDDIAVLFEVLIRFDVDPAEWPDIVDTLTFTDETYAFSKVDINSASETVLAALPGMTPDAAADIVRSRETITAEERATVAWPAIRGIIEPEAYAQLGPWLTARSWTYRVRIALGEVDADEPDGALAGAMVYEAVIDLAAPQPRVAYLRDVSMLRTIAMVYVADEPTEGNFEQRGWYDAQEEDVDEFIVEDAPGLLTDDQSWPEDDLADETVEPEDPETPATRQRLGRWRGG